MKFSSLIRIKVKPTKAYLVSICSNKNEPEIEKDFKEYLSQKKKE